MPNKFHNFRPYLLCCVFAGAISGCNVPKLLYIKQQSSDKVQKVKYGKLYDFEKLLSKTDYKLFEKAAATIQIPASVKNKINQNDKLVICSAERWEEKYSDFAYFIAYSLTEKCLMDGRFVVVRDSVLLHRLLYETNPAFYFSSQSNILTPSPVSSATKMLAFRILDAGIKNFSIKDTAKVFRIAKIYFNLSLIDIPSSQLLETRNIEVITKDTLELTVNSILPAISFQNVTYPFPLLLGFSRPGKPTMIYGEEIIEEIKEPDSTEKYIEFTIELGDYRAYCIITDENNNEVFRSFLPSLSGSNYQILYHLKWDMRTYGGNFVKPGTYHAHIARENGIILSSENFEVK